ncbi:trimethylamine methyltransferase family protein, partial [candidate division KSB1 bacterium]
MRPTLKLLEDDLIKQIIDEALHILCSLGVELHNDRILAMLSDHGAQVDMTTRHVIFKEDIIEKALESVPESFQLYDVNGNVTHDMSGYNVYFTPGNTALHVLDHATQKIRKPVTDDYVQYAKVVNQLPHIASQSTAMIPVDVESKISDSYRLFLSLLYSEKPVVTGTFTAESFRIMKDFQLAVRGSEKELKDKPLTIFSCCPTSPLKWSDVTSQNVFDCAHYSIPVEFVSMPLAGFMSPVTITGTLVQHTAETLSGIVISQLTNPGAPVLYGGSPAIFDVRYET